MRRDIRFLLMQFKFSPTPVATWLILLFTVLQLTIYTDMTYLYNLIYSLQIL
jgi:hypothetical protein